MDNQNNFPQPASPQPDPHIAQLSQYIHQELERGVEAWQLQDNILAAGWEQDLVSQAFMQLGISVIHPPTPSFPQEQAVANNLPQYPQTNQAQQQEYSQTQSVGDPNYATDAQSSAHGDIPQKYRVWTAVFDAIRAGKHNGASLAAAIAVSVIAMGSIIYIAVLAMTSILTAIIGLTMGVSILGLSALSSLGGVIMLIMLSLFVALIIVMAVIQNTTSLAIYAGAEGHKTPPGRTMIQALKSLPRVIIANLLFGFVMLGPYIAFIGLSAFLMPVSDTSGGGLNLLAILFVFLALAWIIIAILRYSLAPYIALFEPQTPILKTLSRSRQLLIHGGQWFIFKAWLLMTLVSIILSLIGGDYSYEEAFAGATIFSGIGIYILLLLANGVMTVLYRNRRLVRG